MINKIRGSIDRSEFTSFTVVLGIIIIASMLFLTFPVISNTNTVTDSSEGDSEYSEAGYLVKKTTEDCFHYVFEGNVANPTFDTHYYFTVFVDDNYVKFEIPVQVFNQHNLGDHITVCRTVEKGKFSDYFGVLYQIKVPAQIVEY